MKNFQSISNEVSRFSYGIPPAWRKGDIGSSNLLAEASALIIFLKGNQPSESQLIELRSDTRFSQFYNNFHREIEEGLGVVFFPKILVPENLSHEELADIFMMFCKFLGQPVPINKQGDVLREVKDTGEKDSVTNPARGHLTNQSLAFHSDRADITTLLCRSIASSGGEFKIGSSSQLFNELRKRPDLLKILSTNIPHDMRDEGKENICSHPIIAYQDIFWVRYIRKFVESIVRFGLSIDEKIKEALDYVDTIVNDDSFSQQLLLEPGDLILFSNHLTLHSRNAFIDNDIDKRCLLRIWLSSAFSRPLPESLKPIFHNVAAGSNRGGIGS